MGGAGELDGTRSEGDLVSTILYDRKPIPHPTFNGQWVLIGDKVTVGSFRGADKPAVVVGLQTNDGLTQVMVEYDRKPPARPRHAWVLLEQGSASGTWEWIADHHPSEA